MAFDTVLKSQLFVVVFVQRYIPAILVQKQESLLHMKSIQPSMPRNDYHFQAFIAAVLSSVLNRSAKKE